MFKESIVKSQNNVFKEMQKSHKGYLSDIGNRHMAQNLLQYKSQGDRWFWLNVKRFNLENFMEI